MNVSPNLTQQIRTVIADTVAATLTPTLGSGLAPTPHSEQAHTRYRDSTRRR